MVDSRDSGDQGVVISENLVPDIQKPEMATVRPLKSNLDHQGYALGDLLVLLDRFFA